MGDIMRLPTTVSRVSPFTGKETTMQISMEPLDYADWRNGKLIQEALPYITPDEREFLMTGILPDEWDTLFAEDDTERDFELDDKEQEEDRCN